MAAAKPCTKPALPTRSKKKGISEMRILEICIDATALRPKTILLQYKILFYFICIDVYAGVDCRYA